MNSENHAKAWPDKVRYYGRKLGKRKKILTGLLLSTPTPVSDAVIPAFPD